MNKCRLHCVKSHPHLFGGDGTKLASLGKVIITDSANHTAYGSMAVATKTEREEYTVTINAPVEFLTSSETVYPVTVDPTVIIDEYMDDYGNEVSIFEDVCLHTSSETPTYQNYAIAGNYSFDWSNETSITSRMLYTISNEARGSLSSYLNTAAFWSASLKFTGKTLNTYVTVNAYPFVGNANGSSAVSQQVSTSVYNNIVSSYVSQTTLRSTTEALLTVNVTEALRYWIYEPDDADIKFVLATSGEGDNDPDSYDRLYIKQSGGTTADVCLVIDYTALIGSYYINSASEGKFLSYNSSASTLGQTYYTSNSLPTSWTFTYKGANKYQISLTSDSSKVLAMNSRCNVFVGTKSALDENFYTWQFSFDGNNALLCNLGAGEYLSAYSGGTVGSSMDESWWRFCKTSAYVNLTSFSIADVACRLGESANYTISKGNNATWSSNTDFVLSSSVNLSVNYSTNTISYDTKDTYEVTATHKPSGKTATFDLVVYRPAVFLIHGRVDNSYIIWGASNNVRINPSNTSDKLNNNKNSEYTLANEYSAIAYQYKNVETQRIQSYSYNNIVVPAITNSVNINNPTGIGSENGNLAYYLTQLDFDENVDIFAFNYPNESSVKFSALLLHEYLNNLALYTIENGSKEQKASLYGQIDGLTASTPLNIHIVGHSMGGLVARYYIENLGKDENVEKLITIDTPHWGSGYANATSDSGVVHVLCDHDLDTNSSMYGGTASEALDCQGVFGKCHEDEYSLTDELKYANSRRTKYYAIAGIDLLSLNLDNDVSFEIPTNYRTYNQLEGAIYNNVTNFSISSKLLGDNIVGLLSQIGWTENDGAAPNKTIDFTKIFINADTNSGNLEVVYHLHSKMAHREVVMEKVFEYLSSQEDME